MTETPFDTIVYALSDWYGDPPEWFPDHARHIINALDRNGYEIREKAGQ